MSDAFVNQCKTAHNAQESSSKELLGDESAEGGQVSSCESAGVGSGVLEDTPLKTLRSRIVEKAVEGRATEHNLDWMSDEWVQQTSSSSQSSTEQSSATASDPSSPLAAPLAISPQAQMGEVETQTNKDLEDLTNRLL